MGREARDFYATPGRFRTLGADDFSGSLNKVEMHPWDLWGASWEPGEQPADAQLHLFDTVAELTIDPDARFGELRSRYDTDDSLRMDGTVVNVLRGQIETV